MPEHITMAQIAPSRGCFHDLSVVLQEGKKRNGDVLRQLANFGYECVVFNHLLSLEKKVQIKPALSLDKLVDDIPTSQKRRPLRVLQRLTVSVMEPSILHALSAPAVETYDLVAIRPGNDKIFQQACSILNVDIISVDLSERVMFNFKHPQVRQAIERGLHFEICYSPAIQDQTARRNTIANAQDLVKTSKGKSIVVSSEATKVFDLRSPLDVTNLCQLFGLKGDQCKAAITTNCRAVLLHSEMRRCTAKGVVSCVKLNQPPEHTEIPLAETQSKSKEKGARARKRPQAATEGDTEDSDLQTVKQKKKRV